MPFGIASGENCKVVGRGDGAGEVDDGSVFGALDVAVDADAVGGVDGAGEVDSNAASELLIGEIMNSEAVAVFGDDFDVALDGEGGIILKTRVSVGAGDPENRVAGLAGVVIA